MVVYATNIDESVLDIWKQMSILDSIIEQDMVAP